MAVDNSKIEDMQFGMSEADKKLSRREEKAARKASKRQMNREAKETHKQQILEGKVKNNEPKKNRSWLLFMISGAVALVVYIALMSMMNSINNNYTKSNVVVTTQAIKAGTDITKDNMGQYLKIIEVPTAILPDDCFVYTGGDARAFVEGKLAGNFTNTDLAKGEIVVAGNLTSNAFYNIGDGDGYVETVFAVGSLVQAVGGSLRRGDIIDIYIYNNQNFEDGVVMENVLIKQACSGDGIPIDKNDTESMANVFSVLMTREQVKTLNDLMNGGGSMRLVKVNNIKY